jgi:ribulose-phosphate 3-epimerase
VAVLAPSIISADFRRLADELARVAPFSVRWHTDVMDGHYVPNLTIGPMVVDAIAKASSLPQDVHLMITNPDETWDWYAKAGAERIAFHPATSDDAKALCERLRGAGVAPGIAVNPDESVDDVRPLLTEIDWLIVMSVYPGFSGQAFIPEALPKLRALREVRDTEGLDIDFVVDGGVSLETATACVEAGADVLVSASAIFGSDDPARVAAQLQAIAEGRASA